MIFLVETRGVDNNTSMNIRGIRNAVSDPPPTP